MMAHFKNYWGYDPGSQKGHALKELSNGPCYAEIVKTLVRVEYYTMARLWENTNNYQV